ncbi:MAG: hypothetical protein HZC43_10495 [Nitrosomonadales bacterium]|nr:hypothetical protein [Nitrosomonadales bacterium]
MPLALIVRLCLRNFFCLISGKGITDDFQQIVIQELLYLPCLGVHDAIQPEIQIGLVKLEQFAEQGL